MYLKALTIRGFKSFARKTVMEFQPGITIIVGPNGSGKSNIADAVMWVLGEQSPLNLRGNRMEDIIFSGSASLKPVNMAEVILSLDNSNSDFPLEYSEINLSRNVVRGGDSEYRLNNSSCRLLDIQELMSDAGIGRSLNSVISQGNLDEVLTCTPEDRRVYIEEAGGLHKYRKRRERAERKLLRMEDELVHTNAILREVKRQLRPLQQQAGRLEKYQKLSSELKETRIKLDITRLRAMHKEWTDYQKAQEEQEAKLKEIEKKLTEKLTGARELESSEIDRRKVETRKRDDFYKLVSVHEQLKATFDLWDQKRASIVEADRRNFEELLVSVRQRKAKAEERVGELNGKNRDVDNRSSAIQKEEAELKVKTGDLLRRIAGIEARLDVIKNVDIDVIGIGSNIVSRMKEELGRLVSDKARIEKKAGQLQDEVDGCSRRISSLESEQHVLSADRDRILGERHELEIKQTYIAATLELLSNLGTGSWGTLNTTVSLLENDPTTEGLGGMLIENLKIDPEYEKAIISYLGPWVFGLIARDDGSIVAAIDYLKRNDLGQSLFFKYLPDDGGRSGYFLEVGEDGEEFGPIPEERVFPQDCIRARKLVSAPEWFNNALGILLDNVVIVENLDKAFKLIDRYPDLVFLTPEGDVISSGVMVKGGSSNVSEAFLQLCGNKREDMERAYAECVSEIEASSLRLFACEEKLESVSAMLEDAGIERIDGRELVLRNSKRYASCVAKIEWIEHELKDEGEECRSAINDEKDIEALEMELEELRKQESRLSGEQQKLEADFLAVSGEQRSIFSELVPLEEEIQSLEGKEKELSKMVSGDEGDRSFADIGDEEFDRVVRCHERILELLEEKRRNIKAELDEGTDGAKQAYSNMHSLQDEIIELQGRHESLRDEIHKEELARTELKIKVEQLISSVVDEHQVPLEFALKQYSVEELENELEQKAATLLGQLERLGPVNPEAITEKDVLEERHGFLKEQLDDIEKSKKELRKVIKDIDVEIESRFVSTLEVTNSHFMEIFSILFPNGKAELKLCDPENILNTGIEILAQPEGKKLRRLSLLSGGEMSLTALAFFFALFKVRPSPFYFLDEVEAALDDVNLYRFLELVKQFKDESQLILVTHQKRSMEIADILYGVTMQDDGVSQVISQKVAV